MLIIDRIEGSVAICEDEEANQIRISLNQLPENISEGDMIVMREGRYQIDLAGTEQRKARIREKIDRLKRR